ncbi:MbtH family protein [Streptomyces sp. NPDC048717]|uniref:MbtH family protein n=1 Tax=unclassified Streptomyces TaxID=2593676 RepID=UPI003432F68B
MFDDNPDRRFRVLRNAEDQYSLWPEDRTAPDGWADAGPRGTRDECLTAITGLWTDLRPLSRREAAAR